MSYIKFSKPLLELLNRSQSKRILLGYSGGADSSLLLHVLLHIKKKHSLDVGVAHIDHGWREESKKEADLIKKNIGDLGLPFYHKRLNPNEIPGNLEQGCREERLKFFKEICLKENYQSVLLAHHQNDLIETVLKRFLEGSSFRAMVGMEDLSKIDGLTILRPFLGLTKKDILKLVHLKQIQFIEDSTNFDPKFLRGKMRSSIIPFLENEFGKSIEGPLARLSKECLDLNNFMEKHLSPFLDQGPTLNCSQLATPFELKWLIQKWAKLNSIFLSYEMQEQLIQDILANKKRKVNFPYFTIQVDRKHLVLERNL